MKLVGKTVYTVNAKTNLVDIWICNGEITGVYQDKEERLCILRQGRKELILPKRFVFADHRKAIEVANSGK